MSARLETQFAGVTFKNPVVTASGTFGFGREFEKIYDLSRLGGLCTKGLTLTPRIWWLWPAPVKKPARRA